MGIYILGMHRSGTSVYARAVGRMIGYTPRDREIRRTNQRGQWEDLGLRWANDDVLARAGCDWSAPSDTLPESLTVAAQDPTTRRRLTARHRALGDEPWVWKDPRNCLTLPLWLALDPQSPALSITVRHPIEVARSLAARNGFPLLYGIALWERYNRSMIDAANGREALFTSFDSLMSRAPEMLAATRKWLETAGIPIHESDPFDHVENELRHAAEPDSTEELLRHGLSWAQIDLYLRLRDRDGTIGRARGDHLLTRPETPTTSALLETRRQVLRSAGAFRPRRVPRGLRRRLTLLADGAGGRAARER